MSEYYGLVNKPPVDEIYNISLVNKPSLEEYDTDLAHFGILGMKWGIRRYQNPDGTLTEAGKKRLSKHQKKIEDRIAKKGAKEARKEILRKRREERERIRFEKNRRKIAKDPDKLKKYQERFTTEEYADAQRRLEISSKIDAAKADKIANGKRIADNVLKYGETLNNAITFINSNAGKAIRQSLGMDTKDLFDFNKKAQSPKEKLQEESEIAKYEYLIAKYQKDLEELNEKSQAKIKVANESAIKDVKDKKVGKLKSSRGKV